jgi:hypothetical protein
MSLYVPKFNFAESPLNGVFLSEERSASKIMRVGTTARYRRFRSMDGCMHADDHLHVVTAVSARSADRAERETRDRKEEHSNRRRAANGMNWMPARVNLSGIGIVCESVLAEVLDLARLT